MVPAPVPSWLPYTVRVAEATGPEPERTAVPRTLFPRRKVTEPLGGVLPVAALTVAVRSVLALTRMLVVAAVALRVVGTADGTLGAPLHNVTRLLTSREPSPVARS